MKKFTILVARAKALSRRKKIIALAVLLIGVAVPATVLGLHKSQPTSAQTTTNNAPMQSTPQSQEFVAAATTQESPAPANTQTPQQQPVTASKVAIPTKTTTPTQKTTQPDICQTPQATPQNCPAMAADKPGGTFPALQLIVSQSIVQIHPGEQLDYAFTVASQDGAAIFAPMQNWPQNPDIILGIAVGEPAQQPVWNIHLIATTTAASGTYTILFHSINSSASYSGSITVQVL